MNERIKELMEQAGLHDFVVESMGIDEEMNKFAELIVRECAGIYSRIDNGNTHMGTDDYLEALHKTFWS